MLVFGVAAGLSPCGPQTWGMVASVREKAVELDRGSFARSPRAEKAAPCGSASFCS